MQADKVGRGLAVLMSTVCAVSGAFAEAKVAPKKSRMQIEEVIVSARKRDESLQEIPLSVTPFSMEQMERRAFTGVEDIAANTPGFSYEGFSTSGTNGNAVIRGLAQQFTTAR
ncbi:MAG: iron complex outermembrane receptor protein, partial [Zhongshania sp.]